MFYFNILDKLPHLLLNFNAIKVRLAAWPFFLSTARINKGLGFACSFIMLCFSLCSNRSATFPTLKNFHEIEIIMVYYHSFSAIDYILNNSVLVKGNHWLMPALVPFTMVIKQTCIKNIPEESERLSQTYRPTLSSFTS
ncbi:TPA: hypothetical protein DEQ89_02810 [Candidatus Daviesbacteria bacterium]|nr:hypothetical protein [Candidatus Daviesbacteria bacterium]